MADAHDPRLVGEKIEAFLYPMSVLYCMTTSLAKHSEGSGAAGWPESKLRERGTDGGFSSVQRVLLENQFTTL